MVEVRDKNTINIIVPTYNESLSKLIKCLSSLTSQDYEGEINTYVVDNSDSYKLKYLEEKFPNVIFLWEKKPGSYNARNRALNYIKDGLVAFTDSDCIASSDWVSSFVEVFQSNPKVDYIAGKVSIFPKNPELPTTAEQFEMLFEFDQKSNIEYDHFGVTANMITKKRVIDEVGNFNGKLKSGGDSEWGKRAWTRGKLGLYADTVIVHHPARSHGEIISKIKRVQAGLRDIDSSYTHTLSYIFMILRPPRRMIVNVLKNKNLQLFMRIKVAVYCLYLTWVRAYFRIKYVFFRLNSPR